LGSVLLGKLSARIIDYRWRQEFGGLKAKQVKRPKDLELENSRLRKAFPI
jgi:hypothetical protein